MTVCSYLLAVYLLPSAVTASTETDRGTITGTVTDATGSVIPDVSIEAGKG